jgi:Flp pilus assembly protein TadD
VGLARAEYERWRSTRTRATEILPNSATALQTLGDSRRGTFRVSRVLRRAVELAPRWAEGRIGFGSVLYETGDARQAVDELQRAIQLDPVEARAHYYLGQVLLREGRRDEAEPHLARAMELQRGLRPVPVEEAVGKTGAWPALLPEPEAGGFRPRRRRGPPACRSGTRRSDEPAA